MALPRHHFQQQQQTPSNSFRYPIPPISYHNSLLRHFEKIKNRVFCMNLYGIDGQNSPAVAYVDPNALQDHSQHPPYVPPFHVVGFAPGPVDGTDGNENGADLQWNCSLESKRRRLMELDFLEKSSPMSSVLQQKSVSIGLGLSLESSRLVSTGDSALLSLIGEDVDLEIQRQDAEFDRFLKAQSDHLRKNVLDKVQAAQLQTLSVVQEKVLQKLQEKEAEMESINKKNIELEKQLNQLDLEARIWQHEASNNEHIIAALQENLDQIIAQSRGSKEGCGDNEVDDTASCSDGHSINLSMFGMQRDDVKELMTCKACGMNEVCMLLLPCKHLCLCKDCESKVSVCPLCRSSKFMGMEVFY